VSNQGRGDPETAAEIEALLAFAPMIEARTAGRWEGGDRRPDGTITLPWFDYDPAVLEFVQACGENGWIEQFDWPAWQPEAFKYYEKPERLAGADVDTIRKLITLHIRKDRFSEGHLAAMVEEGHIAAIFARLAEIRRSIA
jgi:hypothetical protein